MSLPFEKNAILASLRSDPRFAQAASHFTVVPLQLKEVLYHSGTPLTRMLFPVSGLISTVFNMRDGGSVEVSCIGSEGAVGFEILLEASSLPYDQLCQGKGEALAIPLLAAKTFFGQGRPLKQMLAFVQKEMLERGRTAACNRLHSAEERLARWLLVCADRSGSETLELTHEFLSLMLGTRRSTVTIELLKLQHAKLIEHERGQLTITNRSGLQDVACECYSFTLVPMHVVASH